MNPALEIGKTFGGGRYVVEQVLGIGGFGITYYVRHVELGVHYAVKEFFISGKCVRENDRCTVGLQSMDPLWFAKLKKRFSDEARTMAVLNNPHVVKVIDIFEENNTSYIVMEYVPGVTVQQIIDQRGRMSFSDAVNCIGQLSEAVAYIHDKHILHRDIKPDNIIITPDNRVVLIDFGSAREFVNDEVQNQTAIITQGYAPPEQYASTSKKGNYTDVYAVGAVFYFVITGQRPIDSASRSIERLVEPVEIVPDIPFQANRTILKAMELKPEDRYQTIENFMMDLVGKKVMQENQNTDATPKDIIGEKNDNKKRRIWMWIIPLAIVVSFVAWEFLKTDEGTQNMAKTTKYSNSTQSQNVQVMETQGPELFDKENHRDSLSDTDNVIPFDVVSQNTDGILAENTSADVVEFVATEQSNDDNSMSKNDKPYKDIKPKQEESPKAPLADKPKQESKPKESLQQTNNKESHDEDSVIEEENRSVEEETEIIWEVENKLYPEGKYSGTMRNYSRDGFGKFVFDNGNRYEGGWKNNEMHGQGTYCFKNGDKYVGTWKNNKMQEDNVEMYFSNGDTYKGSLLKGKFNGRGTIEYNSSSATESYVGQWKNGKRDGYGTLKMRNGDRYVGYFKNGLFDGEGTYYHASGEKYVGGFKNGKYDGKGKEYFANGNLKAEGAYKDGERIGTW